MNIKAIFDQTVTRATRNDKGEVIGHEPTTLHYTFGSVGSAISGGFYIKVDDLEKVIGSPIEPQKITAIVPVLEINFFVRGDGERESATEKQESSQRG